MTKMIRIPTSLNTRVILTKLSEWIPGSRKCSSMSNGENKDESKDALVLVDQFEDVTLIGLNRPEKRNALNSDLLTALRGALSDFEKNTSSYVGVLYGTGGNFCAGLDLEELSSSSNPELPSIPLVNELCAKPIIGGISGYAVGEGFDLALACDIRVIENKAILGSYNRRFGVPISPVTIARLSSCVGFAFAMQMILTGRPMPGDEAFQRGLCSNITACGSARGEAYTVAKSLVKYPQTGLLADRAMLHQTLALPGKIGEDIQEQRKVMLAAAKKEMKSNAQRFAAGVGKHGTFKNLVIKEHPDWMKD